eukprot:403347656
MGLCKKLIGGLLTFTLLTLCISVLALHYLYQPQTTGTLYFRNAKGDAEILRETETSIPHVYASSEKMALYTQGFLHAQERLWQMERLRRVSQGSLSEVFGRKTLGVDKFFRTLGLYQTAQEAEKNLDEESRELLQSYADGINDFIANTRFPDGQASKLLPPEFLLLGHQEIQPWKPVDSLTIIKLLNFHLSWNWGQDLMRDMLSQSGLEDMVEQIFPYTADYSYNMVTVIDEEDIKGTQFWSDETLSEKYHKKKGTTPKLSAQQRKEQEELTQKQEEKRKLEQEQERQRLLKQKEEEAAKEKQRIQEAEKKQKEQEAKRKQQETEEKQRMLEEERKKQEQEKAKKEQQKKEEEEKLKKQKEQEEQTRKKQAEEDERKKKDEEEKAKKQKEEDEKKKAAEELKRKEQEQKEENERKAKEEKDRLEKEERERKEKEEAERLLKLQEEEKQRAVEAQRAKEQQEKEEAQRKASEEQKAKEAQQETKEEIKQDETIPEQVDQQIYLDEAQESNNWVIHGRHTKNGKPLLAGDPHLGNQIPTHWYLMELNYEGQSLVGSSHPGIPYIMLGKANEMSWAVTSGLIDLSDLYKEILSDDKKNYKVNGEWRDLTSRREVIKIKGEDKPYILDVKETHRGPIMDQEILSGAEVLFSESVPPIDKGAHYSLAWTGHSKEDNTIEIIRALFKTTSVKEAFDMIDAKGYKSVPQNMVVAYNNGDIGYMLGALMPKRKNNTPYSGCRILDGSNTENDWDGYHSTKDMPRVSNPKKGFIVTANNRIVPDHVKNDIGATLTSTIRAQRITELIQSDIDRGHKFDIDDMIRIQNDTVDLMARDTVPFMARLANSFVKHLESEQQDKATKVLDILNHWHGEMSEDSVGATVYSVWQYLFYKTLFTDFIAQEETRLQMSANYPFNDFVQRMFRELESNPEDEDFNKLCHIKNSTYQGKSPCIYNLATSLAQTHDFLTTEVSPVAANWQWKNVHVNEYPNMPWSLTPLKFLFHRETAVGGNGNTVKVSKYTMRKLDQIKRFKSIHTPNYKQVIQHDDSPIKRNMLFSHDAGQNGNLFAGHYFDFQARHYLGKLYRAWTGRQAVKQLDHTTLYIKQETSANQQIKDKKRHSKQEKDEKSEF